VIFTRRAKAAAFRGAPAGTGDDRGGEDRAEDTAEEAAECDRVSVEPALQPTHPTASCYTTLT